MVVAAVAAGPGVLVAAAPPAGLDDAVVGVGAARGQGPLASLVLLLLRPALVLLALRPRGDLPGWRGRGGIGGEVLLLLLRSLLLQARAGLKRKAGVSQALSKGLKITACLFGSFGL